MPRTHFLAEARFQGHGSLPAALTRFNDVATPIDGYSWGADLDTGTVWFDGPGGDSDEYRAAVERFQQDLRAADLTAGPAKACIDWTVAPDDATGYGRSDVRRKHYWLRKKPGMRKQQWPDGSVGEFESHTLIGEAPDFGVDDEHGSVYIVPRPVT